MSALLPFASPSRAPSAASPAPEFRILLAEAEQDFVSSPGLKEFLTACAELGAPASPTVRRWAEQRGAVVLARSRGIAQAEMRVATSEQQTYAHELVRETGHLDTHEPTVEVAYEDQMGPAMPRPEVSVWTWVKAILITVLLVAILGFSTLASVRLLYFTGNPVWQGMAGLAGGIGIAFLVAACGIIAKTGATMVIARRWPHVVARWHIIMYVALVISMIAFFCVFAQVWAVVPPSAEALIARISSGSDLHQVYEPTKTEAFWLWVGQSMTECFAIGCGFIIIDHLWRIICHRPVIDNPTYLATRLRIDVLQAAIARCEERRAAAESALNIATAAADTWVERLVAAHDAMVKRLVPLPPPPPPPPVI